MSRSRKFAKHLLNFAAFVVVGLGIGYLTVDLAVTRGFDPAVKRIGGWTFWPQEASPEADPYTRAHFASFGKFGLMQFEALEFRTEQDSSGAPLDQHCTYVISGPSLPGRWWNIAAYDADRRLIANPANRHSFNSENLIREPDGSFRIIVSPTPHPGNWLPVGDRGPFRLLLTIADPPGNFRTNPATVPVPRIQRESC